VTNRRHLWLLVFYCTALWGCNAGQVFIASPGDYADYRSVRLAETYDERMATAWYYLQHRPDGRYAKRLTRYFDRAEEVFYKVRGRTIGGLEAYLRVLPDGPHAAEALDLLSVLRYERRREELDKRVARQTGLRLDAERKNRAAAAEIVQWWATALLRQSLWDAPLSAAPAPFLVRYSLALPRPECERDQPEPGYQYCTKTVELTYRVAGERGRVDRSVTMDLDLVLDPSWRLSAVTLSGPGLIVRADEARRGRLLDDEDVEVVSAATERLLNALMLALVSDDVECTGGIEPSGMTVLECGRLRLSLAPGRAGDEDVLWIQPIEAVSAGGGEGADGEPGESERPPTGGVDSTEPVAPSLPEERPAEVGPEPDDPYGD
jgi:hypothetical protein